MPGPQWVAAGYTAAPAPLLWPTGPFGDLIGHRRVILAGFGIVGVAPPGYGLAPMTSVLVVVRVMQGSVWLSCHRTRSRS